MQIWETSSLQPTGAARARGRTSYPASVYRCYLPTLTISHRARGSDLEELAHVEEDCPLGGLRRHLVDSKPAVASATK